MSLPTITWSWIVSVAIGLLGISVMVIIHELGHFAAARACGISVQALQFGFGPPIIRWGKYETEYRIAAIPFGGMCKMMGQDDLKNAIAQKKKHIETCEEGSIWSVAAWKRILVYFAGPLSNILFAFICYTILLSMNTLVPYSPAKIVVASDYPSLYGLETCAASQAGLATGDVITAIDGEAVESYEELQRMLASKKESPSIQIETPRGTFDLKPIDGVFGILPFKEAVVGHVNMDTPEKKAGLRPGDRILFANEREVTNMFDLLVESSSSNHLVLTIQRSSKRSSETLEMSFENPDSTLNFTLMQQTRSVPGMDFFSAMETSLKECFDNFKQSIISLANVIRGKSGAHETLGGTFAASQSMGMLTTKGFAAGFNSGMRIVLFLLASVSMSLCVANLLPIPALDGGLIVLSFAELITGHTFHPKLYMGLQITGILIIALIFVLLTFA